MEKLAGQLAEQMAQNQNLRHLLLEMERIRYEEVGHYAREIAGLKSMVVEGQLRAAPPFVIFIVTSLSHPLIFLVQLSTRSQIFKYATTNSRKLRLQTNMRIKTSLLTFKIEWSPKTNSIRPTWQFGH